MAKRKRNPSAKAKCKKPKAQPTAQPTILPADAPVPPAKTSKLNSFTGPSKDHLSSSAKLKAFISSLETLAQKWLLNVPIIKIKGVKLSDLMKRGRNIDADIQEADLKIKAMKDLPAYACSGRFLDEDGVNLASVYAYNFRPANPKAKSSESSASIPYYSGPLGRTVEDVNAKKNSFECIVTWDGIPRNTLIHYHEGTQNLHSKLPPKAHKRDIRHLDEVVMSYPGCAPEGYVREGVDESSSTFLHERAGVTHLAHCWFAQGHPNDPMTPSTNCYRSGKGVTAIEHYYRASEPVARFLAACFKASYPEYYETYSEAFKAGVWTQSDPGPWIARAIVWKLQVYTHQDGLDDGPTAIFNCGKYKGGELYLPDLGLKLAYGPGAVVIFMSGQLYHRISEWEALPTSEDSTVTPGRVGNVFFFPKATLKELKGKPAGWFKAEGSGLSKL